MIEYSKRLVEVDEILNYLDKDEYKKIPENVIRVIKENKDKNYIWKYDQTKELKEQNIGEDTSTILTYINIEYLLNEAQKKLIQEICRLNNQKSEENKILKYNIYNIFPEQKLEKTTENNTKMIVYKENVFKHFWGFLKNIFRK